MPDHYDIAVIGAGIAGLTSAALLAHSGARVVLLEHHDKPGGCAGYFEVPSKRGQFSFPTGATVALGLESGGLHQEIFEKLGVSCPARPLDRLAVYLPDQTVNLWHDAEKWRRERQKLPGHRAGQELFWKVQELVADAGWFALNRKPTLPMQNFADIKRNFSLAHPRLAPMIATLPFSVGETMKWLGVDRDRAFSALVNLQLLITTQSLSHAAPLSNGMAGLDLWRHGAQHPVGGLGSIARQLLEAFRQHGGKVRLSTGVSKVRRRNTLWQLETTDGEMLTAHRVVANVPLWNLQSLLEEPPRTAKLERRAGNGWGAVTLYAAIRESALPADFPLHSQVLRKYHHTAPFLKAGSGDDVFLSLSMPGDENCAPLGWRSLNVSTHVRWQEWQQLSATEYRAKKKEWREKLLEDVRVVLLNFDEAKGFVITGTPSTWESYTLRAGGSVGGAPLTRRNANLRALPSRLGLPNFHLVGDTTFPGQGTVACALSGFNAWRDITQVKGNTI